MAKTFNFCPDSQVPETLPPDPIQGVSFNGWMFTSKPAVPYQKKFKLTLYGLTWFTDHASGYYDITTSPTINARLLEMFYEEHGVWQPFKWIHPHLGPLMVRFNAPVAVPAGSMNSGGLIEKLEIQLIHDNPGYK